MTDADLETIALLARDVDRLRLVLLDIVRELRSDAKHGSRLVDIEGKLLSMGARGN